MKKNKDVFGQLMYHRIIAIHSTITSIKTLVPCLEKTYFNTLGFLTLCPKINYERCSGGGESKPLSEVFNISR